ncbi:hypothetical protein [Chryseobacterium sp. 8AT]|uniref:hypothetical protein n=1 Tax=Chryseobacterium sp. 8AT TaxID=2653134 RepID=UPI0012EF3243|nr:hypothetical protein [Chryseobacterium sp. 8AT]VXB08958.1 conserved hypothetical protein [Chryseobacterium sp. 8AT]
MENEESKSNGMELLGNVIKSNDRNTASNEKNMESNTEVKAGIEDLVLAIAQLQLDFEIVKEIPTKIEIVLSQETKGFYGDFYKKMKMNERFNWSGLGIIILGIFTFVLSINFATNWYKESIKAKSELRQDILKEIADEGQKIYNENEIKILSENTQIMQSWIKSNPKKAEDFLRFKDGFEASMKSK